MEKHNLNGGVLEYDDETHTYWFNGKKAISTTQIIDFMYPGKYANVDKEVVRRKGKHGTEVHTAIECYVLYGIERPDLPELMNFKLYVKCYGLEVLDVELPIVVRFTYEGEELIVCGRTDMVLKELSGEICVEDHKTTCELDRLRLSIQLSIYRYGLKQSYDRYKDVDMGLRCMHLNKNKREYVIVDSIDVEQFLIDYIKERRRRENGE